MPNRRVFLLIGFVALSAVATGSLLAYRHFRHPRNVVVICLDTVRYDTFYLRDTSRLHDAFSPWLQRAIRFDNTQSAAPWTIPSVATVLTGLYPPHHGAGRFEKTIADLDLDTPTTLASGVTTLADQLKANGFETVAFYDNPVLDEVQQVLRGFAVMNRIPSSDIPSQGRKWLASHARDDKPFFLYLHLMEAHNDHMKDMQDVKAAALSLPPDLTSAVEAIAPAGICRTATPPCIRYLTYAKAISYQRTAIAGVLEELEKQGLLDSTIVVLFSDHGEEFRDHRRAESRFGNDPRNLYGMGHGHSLYQELLHVPLLAWHPHYSGRSVMAPVSLVDVAPTIADWLGLSMPAADGVSVASIDGLDKREDLKKRIRYSTGIAYGPEQYGAVQNGVKRIARTMPSAAEIFDLRNDPRERAPLAEEPGPRLASALLSFAKLLPIGTTEMPTMTPERLAALQSIGYLTGGATTTNSGASPAGTTTSVAAKLWAVPSADELDCDKDGIAQADVYWSAPLADDVKLWWHEPGKLLWTGGEPSGHLVSGHWIMNGDTLFLQDTSGDIRDPKGKTVATLIFHCKGSSLASTTH